MGDSLIQVLPDSTGKKIATRQRTVGANSVEEQYIIESSVRVRSGIYMASILSVAQVTATNGTSTGFWWLYNPVGSTTLIALRRARFMCQYGVATVATTSPRVSLNLFTFTGTPAGTAVTPGKGDSTSPTATATLRTTQVTSVVTLGAAVKAYLCQANQLTSSGGPVNATFADWNPTNEDGMPVLRAGEGIVCYQPDAGGPTSDTRRIINDIAWEEYTVP